MNRIAKVARGLWILAVCCLMVYCLWGLIRDSRELNSWKVEAARLEKLVGHVDMRDGSEVQVISIKNEGPGELLWRVNVPAGGPWVLKHQMAAGGGGSAAWNNNEQEDMLVRSRFLKREGRWTWFIVHPYGSGANGVSDEMGEFVARHWDQLDVRLAAPTAQASYLAEEVINLLTVTVPDSLLPVAKEELGDYTFKQLRKGPLLKIELGTSAAFELAKVSVANEQNGG